MIDVHPSWQSIVQNSYNRLDFDYREFLESNIGYFPNYYNFLNAFKTLSLENTRYILFGQDPYPRENSATGYAFIDGAVKYIFDVNGLSKSVNRATSLRNFIKMLLVAKGDLSIEDTTPKAIQKVDKEPLIKTIMELKDNFEKSGVLLLNTSLVFTKKEETSVHVKKFLPFVRELLLCLKERNIELIMLGNVSKMLQKRVPLCEEFAIFEAMHPYNLEFIKDSSVRDFFQPMNLLLKR